MQTVNFAYVAEKNRVVVVSVASFMWTIFLSYMHHVQQDALPAFLRRKTPTGRTKNDGYVESQVPNSKWMGVKFANYMNIYVEINFVILHNYGCSLWFLHENFNQDSEYW